MLEMLLLISIEESLWDWVKFVFKSVRPWPKIAVLCHRFSNPKCDSITRQRSASLLETVKTLGGKEVRSHAR